MAVKRQRHPIPRRAGANAPPAPAAAAARRGGAPEAEGVKTSELEVRAPCRILRKLAEGGMGAVYLAEQLGVAKFAKTVAVKVIKRERLKDKQTLRMFIDEAHLTADLVHANIAQVYTLGRHRGRYFIVMEYLHGITVERYLNAHRKAGFLPPLELSAFIASRVARGLAYAHSKRDRTGRPLGVVHRDVTPGNIFLDFRGQVKLTDFGIAKALTVRALDESRYLVGKLPYMSTEQAEGGVCDARTDIYALGAVLFELLIGRKLHPVQKLDALMKQFKAAVPDLTRLNPHIAPELAGIVAKTLAPDPRDRFVSSDELLTALEHYMYHDRYGPTNEKLAVYLQKKFPGIDRDRIA